jgi:hypothetical protein
MVGQCYEIGVLLDKGTPPGLELSQTLGPHGVDTPDQSRRSFF